MNIYNSILTFSISPSIFHGLHHPSTLPVYCSNHHTALIHPMHSCKQPTTHHFHLLHSSPVYSVIIIHCSSVLSVLPVITYSSLPSLQTISILNRFTYPHSLCLPLNPIQSLQLSLTFLLPLQLIFAVSHPSSLALHSLYSPTNPSILPLITPHLTHTSLQSLPFLFCI